MTLDKLKIAAKVLADLAKANADGDVEREELVRAAKRKAHPLHDEFEWNDKVLGQKARLERAGQIIREVKLHVILEQLPVSEKQFRLDIAKAPDAPAFVRDGYRPSGVRSIEELRKDTGRAQASLLIEVQQAIGIAERARDVAVALGIPFAELVHALADYRAVEQKLQAFAAASAA